MRALSDGGVDGGVRARNPPHACALIRRELGVWGGAAGATRTRHTRNGARQRGLRANRFQFVERRKPKCSNCSRGWTGAPKPRKRDPRPLGLSLK
jgi:hypothetical protein